MRAHCWMPPNPPLVVAEPEALQKKPSLKANAIVEPSLAACQPLRSVSNPGFVSTVPGSLVAHMQLCVDVLHTAVAPRFRLVCAASLHSVLLVHWTHLLCTQSGVLFRHWVQVLP